MVWLLLPALGLVFAIGKAGSIMLDMLDKKSHNRRTLASIMAEMLESAFYGALMGAVLVAIRLLLF